MLFSLVLTGIPVRLGEQEHPSFTDRQRLREPERWRDLTPSAEGLRDIHSGSQLCTQLLDSIEAPFPTHPTPTLLPEDEESERGEARWPPKLSAFYCCPVPTWHS